MEVIGIDSAIFIYLFEEHPRYLKRAERLLYAVQKGKIAAVFSAIGLMEILVGPKKSGDYELAAKYRDLVTHFDNLTIAGLNENVIELASDLRAKYGLLLPDCIHLATAIDFGAHAFVTNDKALKKVKEIKVQLLR